MDPTHYYAHHSSWKAINQLMPEGYQLDAANQPNEVFIDWQDWKIHLDVYEQEAASATIILLHGAGGNGRLLSFIAVPLQRAGIRVVVPDLPGYGHSQGNKRKLRYAHWVELVAHLIDEVQDGRAVYVFGLSAGGMLAYQAAAQNPKVAGIIATNLLDLQDKRVLAVAVGSTFKSRVVVPLLKLITPMLGGMMLPVKSLTNMEAVVNNKQLLKLLLADSTASGARVALRFLKGTITTKPAVSPEAFQLPVLLLHPAADRWTPLWSSEVFYHRLKGPKRLKLLENAGHFPIEKPGIGQISEEILKFIEQEIAE